MFAAVGGGLLRCMLVGKGTEDILIFFCNDLVSKNLKFAFVLLLLGVRAETKMS